ncbi:50S ribosomal protein L20 [Candidatus Vidania fulgoroideorum]
MTRVKYSVVRKNRRKKVLLLSKGFKGRRKNVYKISKQSVLKSLIYSYRDRKKKKSFFRKKFIKFINIYLNKYNIKYNFFIFNLKIKKVIINRKMLYLFILNNKYNGIKKKLINLGC